MSRPKIRVFVPETPLNVKACAAETHSVGLGRAPVTDEHRVFIFFVQEDEPDRGEIVHLSIDNAAFLRDAIDTVLQEYRVITGNAN
jgi:hypothetical protein